MAEFPLYRVLDTSSQSWRHVRAHINERIAALQVKLEEPIDPGQTAETRGRISELRALIKAAEENPLHSIAQNSEDRPPLYT